MMGLICNLLSDYGNVLARQNEIESGVKLVRLSD